MNTNTLAPKAIGVLSLDVTGPHRLRDERVITELAQRRGYTLTGLVTIGDDTFMPTTLIVGMACSQGASAIIAPSTAHFISRARALSLACDLITPTKFVGCTSTNRLRELRHE